MKEKYQLENYTYHTEIQIRWNDLDPLGHVNNAVYITYFEIARGTYMLTASPTWDWKKNMFLIGNVQVNFLKEMTLYCVKPRISVRVKRLGIKSFVLEYIISSQNLNGEQIIHAAGETTQVMFDMKNRTTIEIPDWLRQQFQQYEKEGTIE